MTVSCAFDFTGTSLNAEGYTQVDDVFSVRSLAFDTLPTASMINEMEAVRPAQEDSMSVTINCVVRHIRESFARFLFSLPISCWNWALTPGELNTPWSWASKNFFPEGGAIVKFSRNSQKHFSGWDKKVVKFCFTFSKLKAQSFFAKDLIEICQISKSRGGQSHPPPPFRCPCRWCLVLGQVQTMRELAGLE